jgi:hypothetical protein
VPKPTFLGGTDRSRSRCICRADESDGSGTGTPDGVTIDDLLDFLLRFEAGC